MQQRPSKATSPGAVRWSAAAIAATMTALGGFGAGVGGPDGLVMTGFESALARSAGPNSGPISGLSAAPAAVDPGSELASRLAQLSGSEDFWLGSAGQRGTATVPVRWSGAVAKGDRITIGAESAERRLEVVDIRPIGEIPAATGSVAEPLLLVTCRDLALPNAPPVRFVIESGTTLGAPARAPHAL